MKNWWRHIFHIEVTWDVTWWNSLRKSCLHDLWGRYLTRYLDFSSTPCYIFVTKPFGRRHGNRLWFVCNFLFFSQLASGSFFSDEENQICFNFFSIERKNSLFSLQKKSSLQTTFISVGTDAVFFTVAFLIWNTNSWVKKSYVTVFFRAWNFQIGKTEPKDRLSIFIY